MLFRSETKDTFSGSNVNGDFEYINKDPTVYFKQITTSGNKNYIYAGTVDYTNGIIYIKNIDVFDFLDNNGIRVTVVPVNNDVVGSLYNVVEIDMAEVKVTTEVA